MFIFFISKEKKRIKYLFNLFVALFKQGISKECALVEIWGEVKMRTGPLKDSYGFSERSIDSKKLLIQEIFRPLNVAEYDIYKTISFMISWEFPEKYNRPIPAKERVEQIRTGRGAKADLDQLVREIGELILKD